jgi:hypothetical protein
MSRTYKTVDTKLSERNLTATEIRKLPKAERDRILKEQFILGGKMYSENPDSIITASPKIHA